MIFLQTHLIVSVILISLFSLAIGSFLNVVIVRYPQMLRRAWRRDCREFLELSLEPAAPTYNLLRPRSQCSHCQQALSIWHNIPLFSYLILRGRCGFCQHRISLQYPVVELITLLAAVAVLLQYGWQMKTAAIWLLTAGLIVLSAIDWETQILPDDIIQPLLWIGLILNITSLFTPLANAVLGAVSSYILLFIVAWLFKKIRKKPGMGHGDFKMLAMFGAWLGTPVTLYVLLFAILISLMINLCLLFFKKIHYHQPLPFGPWLAMAGWVVLVYQPHFTAWVIPWL